MAGEWKPIETAPINELVIVWGKNVNGIERRVLAFQRLAHSEPAEFEEDTEWLDEVDGEFYYPGGWYEQVWCHPDFMSWQITDTELVPELWQPLPEPPTAPLGATSD